MPNTIARTVSTGATATYSVPFPYLDKAHAKIYRDATLLVNGVDYTWPTSSSVLLSEGIPAVGVVITRQRVTPVGQLTVFAPGNLGSDELNKGDLQSLYVAEEAWDVGSDIGSRAWVTKNYGLGRTIELIAKGHFLKTDADGNLVDAGPADNVVNAQGYADAAALARDAAEAARNAALAAVPSVFPLTMAALRGVDPDVNTVAYLLEAGRRGQFLWLAGDQSSKLRPTVGTTSAVAAAETINGYSATHVLTIANHGLYTGCPVTPTTSVNGLTAGTTYYVIKLSANKFTLATTRALALAYTVRTLSGTTNLTLKRVVDALEAVYVVPTGLAADGSQGVWVRDFDGCLNVQWFGAVGDGATDDTPAFAAAGDLLSVNVFKALRVPAVTSFYWLNNSGDRFIVDHVTGLRLYGDGESSQIKFGNSAGPRSFYIMWCTGVAEKLNFNSTGRAGGVWDNVTLANPTNFSFQDNIVQGADFYGVGAFADIVFPSSLLYMSVAMDNFHVVANRFVNCGAGTNGTPGYGIECFPWTKSKNLRMVFNTFENCGGAVGGTGTAALKGGSAYENGLIAFNKIVNSPASAIHCGTHESVVIEANEIIDWARSSIAATYAAIGISVNTHPFYLTPTLALMMVRRNTIRMATAMPAASNAYGLSVNGNVTTNGPVCFDDNDVFGCNGLLMRSSVAVPNVEITRNRFDGMANTEAAVFGDATSGSGLPKVKIAGNRITSRTGTRTLSQVILASFTDVEITDNVLTRGGNFDLNLTTCAGAIIDRNTFVEPNVANTSSVGCIVITDTNAATYTLTDNKIIKGAAGNPKSLLVCSSAIPTFRSKGNKSDTLATLTSSATPNVQGDWLDVPVPEYGIVTGDAGATLTPFVSAPVLQHSGTLTADRTINLSGAGAVAGKTKWRITRTGAGAFNLNVAALKALAPNTWCEVTWNGAVYYLSAYGAL